MPILYILFSNNDTNTSQLTFLCNQSVTEIGFQMFGELKDYKQTISAICFAVSHIKLLISIMNFKSLVFHIS